MCTEYHVQNVWSGNNRAGMQPQSTNMDRFPDYLALYFRGGHFFVPVSPFLRTGVHDFDGAIFFGVVS